MRSACLLFFAVVIAALLLPSAAVASDRTDAEALVTKADITYQSFMKDTNFSEMRRLSRKARGIFVAPEVLKGAFFIGGSGGTGVFLARGEKGNWTYPVFYTMGSVSYGLQFGGQASEVILLAMTQKGVNTMLDTSVKLGADVGIAAGPYGAGAQAATENLSADILVFSRSKGLYGGVSLDGAVMDVRDSLNRAYYGKKVTPKDIMLLQKVSNKQADPLRYTLQKISGTE